MKNELFCSRLARIRAHTPRRAKMKKILTRILKRACKRFNIEREDLFDAPDSSARSKSSPREPVAEGDENVEWLALDATKRCTEKKRTMMWRRSRDEIAEEEDCAERFFVGFDRE